MNASLQIGFFSEVEDKTSLNIYLSGCRNNKRCRVGECHNPLMRSFTYGTPIRELYPRIKHTLQTGLVDAVVLLGGEPFDQEVRDLVELINVIREVDGNIPIYAYSGYEFEEIAPLATRLGLTAVCTGPYLGEGTQKRWFSLVSS